MKLNHIYTGDCLQVMQTLPDNCVDSVVTDPPYNLVSINKRWSGKNVKKTPAMKTKEGSVWARKAGGFMGKAWDGTGISFKVELWKEALRVLKHGGHLLSFGGTRTYHRMACAIEDAGFEIRDMIAWVYSSGFPKSLNIGKKIKKYKGWGTAFKPALEPICVSRKPLSEKTVAKNVLKWGIGGINIDGCRVEANLEKEDLARGRKSNGGAIFGSTNKKVKIKANSLGRFPANLIHDGSDEVVSGFPNKTSRFFYCAKASKSERNMGCEGMEEKKAKSWHFKCKKCGKTYSKQSYKSGCHCEKPDVEEWTGTSKNNHPTVKPLALMRYLVKLVTPPEGIVLDPFIGSGTTGIACFKEGFKYVGIEMEKDYVRIARARIKAVTKQQRLF